MFFHIAVFYLTLFLMLTILVYCINNKKVLPSILLVSVVALMCIAGGLYYHCQILNFFKE